MMRMERKLFHRQLSALLIILDIISISSSQLIATPQYALIGESVTLSCINDGYPWFFLLQVVQNDTAVFCNINCNALTVEETCLTVNAESTICNDTLYETRIDYTFAAVQERDFTEYICSRYQAMYHLEIELFENATVELRSDTNFTQEENSSMTLHCNTSGGNPLASHAIWFIDGEEQTENDTSLTFVTERGLNGKEVWCEAFQLEYRDTIPSEKHILNITYPPGIATLNLERSKVDISENITLSCTINETNKGNPDFYEYIFYHNSEPINDWQMNSNLVINIINVTQEGNYKCQARNTPQCGVFVDGDISNSTYLQVYVPPEILNPRNGTIFKPYFNDSFSISCEALGKSGVDLKLYRNDEEVNDTVFSAIYYEFNLTEHKYGLTKGHGATFTWNSDNIGDTCETVNNYDSANYTCKASNNGTGYHEVFSVPFAVETQYPAFWNSSQTYMYAIYNQSEVDLICDICANPMPATYTWYNGTTRIGSDASNTYTLFQVGDFDFTTYFCAVDNGIGFGVKSFGITLLEDGPSGAPIDFQVLPNITSTSISLTWRDGRDGGWPPLTHHLYQSNSSCCSDQDAYHLVANITGVANGTEESMHGCVIENLKPGSQYHFKVVSSNNRNEGVRESEAVFACGIATKEPPLVVLVDCTLSTSSSLKVAWQQHVTANTFEADDYSQRLRIVYGETGGSDDTIYPTMDQPALDVSAKQYAVPGAFDESKRYSAYMMVYENDNEQNSYVTDTLTSIPAFESNKCKKDSTGFIIAVVVIAAFCAGFLLSAVMAIAYVRYCNGAKFANHSIRRISVRPADIST